MGTIQQLSVLKGMSTGTAKMVRLHRLLEANASKSSSENFTSLIYSGLNGEAEKLSLWELDTKSNQLARAILQKTSVYEGNGDGDCIIAVALPPSIDLIVTLLAIWKTGGAYLPLDHCAPPQRVKHILGEAKPLLVITEADAHNNGIYNGVKVVSYFELEKLAQGNSTMILNTSECFPSNSFPIAIVLYTSGSTGIPKGVRIPHSAILNRLLWQWREFPYSSEESFCIFKTALTFVDSVSEIWGPLLCPKPRTIVIVPREITKDPSRLIKILDQYKVERLVLVPTLLRAILMYLNISNERKLQNLHLWICSGETLAVSLATQFVEYFGNGSQVLCNFYGSTEIMGDVSYHTIRNSDDINFDGKVPIGVPVDNTILYLLDKHLQVVPMGETGELYVAGRNLAAGYVNGRDAFRFVDNPHVIDLGFNQLYRTGDYAKIMKGTLIYEGRSDSQVKVRGHRVDLSEIETALNKIKGVQKGVVLCYKPGEINQVILAFVLLESDSNISDREIELFLELSLPPYAIPQVISIEKMPLLINGKIDRQFLLKTYEEISYRGKENEYEFDYTGISSQKLNAAECLFKTVASVLGSSIKGRISTSGNFYNLGGNSLNSVYTVTKLRDLGYLVSITDFISSKSLGEIVDKMVHEDSGKHAIRSQMPSRLKSEMIQPHHKADVYKIITDSFYEKADLERWIEPPIKREAYTELMDAMWDPLLDKNLSFVVKSESGKIIGASLNFDVHDEPDITVTSQLTIVFNFLEYIEGPIRDRKLPQGKGKIVHSFMMGTHKDLSGPENVEVIEFMEEETLKLVKERSFFGIFTTNSSPLTQQLGVDVFNFQVMHNYQVNQYVAANGTRPFKNAPDAQKVVCCWKTV